MAFTATVTTGNLSSTATPVIPLPATVSANDRIIIILSYLGTTSATWPAGWDERYDTTDTTVGERICDGTEDGGTVTVTISNTRVVQYAVFHITAGHHTSAAIEVDAATNTSSTPDPPSLTPTFSGPDYRIVTERHDSSSTTVSAYPTNFTDNQASQGSSGGNGRLSVAARDYASGGALDPGTFTLSASRAWRALHIAVRSNVVQLTADPGAYAVTGQTAGLYYGYAVSADAGSYSVTGQTAGLFYGYAVSADAGSYSVTGQAVGIEHGWALTAEAGAYTTTGQAVTLSRDLPIVAEPGSYAVAGQSALLEHSRVIGADAGSYAISGQTAGLEFGRRVDADAGSYVVSGTAADLTLDTVGGYDLPAESGLYGVSGSAVAIEHGRQASADPGSHSVSGQTAALLYGRSVECSAESYAVNGQSVGALYGRLIVAEGGGYVLVGTNTALLYGYSVSADSGSYAVAGQSATLTPSELQNIGAASGVGEATAVGVARTARSTGRRPVGAQTGIERVNRQSARRINAQPDGIRR